LTARRFRAGGARKLRQNGTRTPSVTPYSSPLERPDRLQVTLEADASGRILWNGGRRQSD